MPEAASRFTFEVEHIISRKHQGSDALDNLALACGHCNRFKGTNIAGIDPITRQMARLFNPRTDTWRQHFHYEGPAVVGITDIGRTTVVVLNLNHHQQVAARLALLSEGIFPLE